MILLICLFLFFSSNTLFAKEETMGYYLNSSNSEYLSFSQMNKDFGITSLMNSAISNDSKATEIFIVSGANVNQKNIAGATALHLASRNGAYESAVILINHNADIDPIDNEGWTPLMRASLAGDEKIMNLLISNGADKWKQNKNGETPLILASMADCTNCVKTILNNSNTNTNLFRSQCYKALKIANNRYNEDLIKLLKCNENGQITYEDIYSEKNDYLYDSDIENSIEENNSNLANNNDNYEGYTNKKYITENEKIISRINYIWTGDIITTNQYEKNKIIKQNIEKTKKNKNVENPFQQKNSQNFNKKSYFINPNFQKKTYNSLEDFNKPNDNQNTLLNPNFQKQRYNFEKEKKKVKNEQNKTTENKTRPINFNAENSNKNNSIFTKKKYDNDSFIKKKNIETKTKSIDFSK